LKTIIPTTLYKVLFFTALSSITVLAFLPNYNALPKLLSFSDLLNHTIAFITLSYLLQKSYKTLTNTNAFTLLFIYAVGIEVVQHFLPTRVASLSDIVADVTGILLGFVILKSLKHYA